ncbi:hypothetical protein J6590_022343 [Homalodisca vitripennis]|nr:hypothetical protein J6590_022343 [Homalodisca vitripennis]
MLLAKAKPSALVQNQLPKLSMKFKPSYIRTPACQPWMSYQTRPDLPVDRDNLRGMSGGRLRQECNLLDEEGETTRMLCLTSSILSPIIFLMYVNDVGSSLLHGRLVQYADDTTLCFTSKSKLILKQQSFEVENCVQHFNSLNIKTNSAKSNFQNFALRLVDRPDEPGVMLADTMLEEVYCSKSWEYT